LKRTTLRMVLAVLDLSRNDIRDEGAACLFTCLSLPPLASLHTFDISANAFELAGGSHELVQALQKRASVRWKQVDFSQNALGDQGSAALVAHAFAHGRCQSLTSLSLRRTEMAALGMGALARCVQAGHLASLARLDISDNGIHLSDAKDFLAALQAGGCPKLRALNVSKNRLGDEGLVQLVLLMRVGAFRALEELDISANQAYHSLHQLALTLRGERCCPRLRALSAGGNAPEDVSVPRLFRGLPLRVIA
jgi:Ran GTPase-activating protein (RanGAP) involved in mRNA processing and transport